MILSFRFYELFIVFLRMKRGSIVAVSFERHLRDATEIFNSFQSYAREHGLKWDVIPLNYAFESTLVQLAHSGELLAAVGSFISDAWLEGLLQNDLYAINLLSISHIKTVPSINIDQVNLGLQAAHHLHHSGARNFAYFGSKNMYSNRLQFEGFASSRFIECVVYISNLSDLYAKCQRVSGAERPLGILCESDRHARLVIYQMKQMGWQCGQDYLVIGIGSDPTQSALAGTGISSFRLPTHLLGYGAAKALHRCIEAGNCPRYSQSLRAEFILDESSLPIGPSGLAQRALSRLHAHVSNSEFTVTQFARELGLSRRSLEQTFKNEFGSSPYKTLGELRFEKAKQLLSQYRLPIREIARRCGCMEAAYFSSWFKKRAGYSPLKYRMIEESR